MPPKQTMLDQTNVLHVLQALGRDAKPFLWRDHPEWAPDPNDEILEEETYDHAQSEVPAVSALQPSTD